MANYYKTAIISVLDDLSENKLCFVYTLLMKLLGREEADG